MATGKKASKKRRTNVDVETFEGDGDEEALNDDAASEAETEETDTDDELADVDEPTDEDLNDEAQEDDEVASATSKAKTRVKNAPDVEDEVADEDEVDEEEADDTGSSFAPYIAHKDQEWDITDLFENADEGEAIIIYDSDNERWYKLLPITVGELTE